MNIFAKILVFASLLALGAVVNLRADNPHSVVHGLKEKLDAFSPAEVKLAALTVSDKLLTSKVEGDAWLGLVEEIAEAESLDGFDLTSHDVEAIAKAAETINVALKEHDKGDRLLLFDGELLSVLLHSILNILSPLIYLLLTLVGLITTALLKEERIVAPLDWEIQGTVGQGNVKLSFFLKTEGRDPLEQELLERSDPSSASYGKWLSNDEVHALVAPSDEAVEKVT